MENKEVTIGFVTGNTRKVDTFKACLPEYPVVQVKPLVEEKLAASTIFSHHNFHNRTAEAKAFSDMGAVHAFAAGLLSALQWWAQHDRKEIAHNSGHHVALYSDCVRYIAGREEPIQKAHSVDEAVDQAMLQSGRDVDICIGFTGILLTECFPHASVGVVTHTRMKEFSEQEVRDFIGDFGAERIFDISGVLPIAEGARFFDQTEPLQVNFYPDITSRPLLIEDHAAWDHLSEPDLHRFHVGTFSAPIDQLIFNLTSR